MTFAEARKALLAHLAASGWSLSSPFLKTQHATKEDVRLYFRPQAVWYSRGNTHDANRARSLHIDIRMNTPEGFVSYLEGYLK